MFVNHLTPDLANDSCPSPPFHPPLPVSSPLPLFILSVSTLPEDWNHKGNLAADIHVAPSGDYLYASNRGHDSIVIYKIDGPDGCLHLVGTFVTCGEPVRSLWSVCLVDGNIPAQAFKQSLASVRATLLSPPRATCCWSLAKTPTPSAPWW